MCIIIEKGKIRKRKERDGMEISKWLKGVTIGIAIMGVLFFAWIMPVTADTYRIAVPELAFLYWPGMIYGWTIGAGCYAILFQFWNVCTQIGKDNSFSMENVKSFQRISRIAAGIGVIWFVGMLFLAWNRWVNPAILVFMVVALFLCITVTIMAAALSHLVYKAYEMKQENELTI